MTKKTTISKAFSGINIQTITSINAAVGIVLRTMISGFKNVLTHLCSPETIPNKKAATKLTKKAVRSLNNVPPMAKYVDPLASNAPNSSNVLNGPGNKDELIKKERSHHKTKTKHIPNKVRRTFLQVFDSFFFIYPLYKI